MKLKSQKKKLKKSPKLIQNLINMSSVLPESILEYEQFKMKQIEFHN